MLRRDVYIGRKIWNQRRYLKTPGTNKRVAKKRPRSEWQIVEAPELRIVSPELWDRVHDRQKRLSERYKGGGRPQYRAAYSNYLLSGFMVCGDCGSKMCITSVSKGRIARYGCPTAFNRSACPNRLTVRHNELEIAFFARLQEAVLTPDVVNHLVKALMKSQRKKSVTVQKDKRIRDVKAETVRLVAAIASIGHSEALITSLKEKERELRQLESRMEDRKQYTEEEVEAFVSAQIKDITAVLRKNAAAAKDKLAAHIDEIRMQPIPEGFYVAEGRWDLLGSGGLQMVAGVGFEPTTFGL
jgi:site-specific DNA recombinase